MGMRWEQGMGTEVILVVVKSIRPYSGNKLFINRPLDSSRFPACYHASSYACCLVCSHFYETARIKQMALLCGFLKKEQILMGTNIYYL